MNINCRQEKYIGKATEAFRKKADPENAENMKKYMRNKFKFFGIKAKPRREATREFMKKTNCPDYENINGIIKKLWQLPEREYQYFAAELIERYEKEFTPDIINLFEYMITNKSWWDTVDRIAKKPVGTYFKLFPEKRDKYIEKWLMSDNIWLQRTTLLFQLAYKETTDVKLLFYLIEQLKDLDEFFIQKAIGWSLREYSRIEPETVREFIKGHKLSSLSRREGLKVIRKSN